MKNILKTPFLQKIVLGLILLGALEPLLATQPASFYSRATNYVSSITPGTWFSIGAVAWAGWNWWSARNLRANFEAYKKQNTQGKPVTGLSRTERQDIAKEVQNILATKTVFNGIGSTKLINIGNLKNILQPAVLWVRTELMGLKERQDINYNTTKALKLQVDNLRKIKVDFTSTDNATTKQQDKMEVEAEKLAAFRKKRSNFTPGPSSAQIIRRYQKCLSEAADILESIPSPKPTRALSSSRRSSVTSSSSGSLGSSSSSSSSSSSKGSALITVHHPTFSSRSKQIPPHSRNK